MKKISFLWLAIVGNFSLYAENKACENVSNIQVSNISPTATNITWTNPDNATNKTELLITTKTLTDIEISTNSASESIFLRDTVENTNTYTISQKLGNNTIYYIYMRHWCDEEDKSSWSDSVSFQSPYMLPYTPFNNFVYETSTFMPDWTRTGDLQYSENTITTAALADAAATSGTWSAQNNAEDNLMDNPYTRIMCGSAGHRWMLSPVIDMTDVATDTTVLLKFKLALSTSSTISDETWESLQDSLILMVKDADAEYWSMTNSIQWYNSTNNDHINPDGTVNPNRYSYSRIGKDTAITYFVDMSAYAGKKIQLAFYIVSKETASYGFNIGDLELDYAQHGSIHTTTLCLPTSDENKLSTQLQTRFGNNYTVCDYANEMYDINVDSLKAGTHTLMIYCPATETSAQHIEAMIATLNQTPEIEFAEAYFEGEIYKNDEFAIDTMIMPESSSDRTMMIILDATESLPCEGYIYFENVLAPDSLIVDTFVSINKLPYVYTYENETIVNIASAEIGNTQQDTAWLTIDRVNGKATRLFHTIHFIMNAEVDINETYFVGEHYTNDSLFIDTILIADADNSMYIAVDTTETTPIGGYVKFHNVLAPDSLIVDTFVSINKLPYVYTYENKTIVNITSAEIGNLQKDTAWLTIDRVNGKATRLFHTIHFIMNAEVDITEAYFVGEHYTNDSLFIDTILTADADNSMYIAVDTTETTPIGGYVKFHNVLAPDSIIVDTFVSINKLPYVYTYENETIVNIASAEIGNTQQDTAWLTTDRVNGKATRLFHTIHFIMNAEVDINETYFVGEHYTNDSLFIDTILIADADNSMYIAVDTTETTPIGGYVKFHKILTPDSIVIDTAISVDSFPYAYVQEGDTILNYISANVGDTLRDTLWLTIDRDNEKATRLFLQVAVIENSDTTESALPIYEIGTNTTRKELRNGNVYIIKQGKSYNLMGIKVKEEEE